MSLKSIEQRRDAIRWRWVAVVAVSMTLSACSSLRPWQNQPLRGMPTIDRQNQAQTDVADRDPSLLVAVTLSGGGARAAAFGYGVLRAMGRTHFQWNGRHTDLLDAADVVSGVSGGSIVAAYLAAYGQAGLPDFEKDFLRQNFQNSLILQSLQPSNLYDMTSPWFGRSNLLERRLDLLYGGMTYADIERRPRHPQLLIAATDMALGTGFEFTAEQFAIICSDIGAVPLSFAVAASSAVPLLLSPLTLRNHSRDCARPISPLSLLANPERAASDYRSRMFLAQERSYKDAQAAPYIHLVDGGVADNLGVRNLLDRALAGGGLRASFGEVRIPPGSIRKLILITVNAERDPSSRIGDSGEVPSTAQVAETLVFGVGARAAHETQEYLTDLARQWRSDIQHAADGADAFAKDAEIHVIQVNLRDARDADTRRFLLQVPTAFSIQSREVDELIQAGQEVLIGSKDYRNLLRSLQHTATP